jgi:hypothetical protein
MSSAATGSFSSWSFRIPLYTVRYGPAPPFASFEKTSSERSVPLRRPYEVAYLLDLACPGHSIVDATING